MEGRNISIFAFIQNEKDEVLLVLNKEEERQDGGFTNQQVGVCPADTSRPTKKTLMVWSEKFVKKQASNPKT